MDTLMQSCGAAELRSCGATEALEHERLYQYKGSGGEMGAAGQGKQRGNGSGGAMGAAGQGKQRGNGSGGAMGAAGKWGVTDAACVAFGVFEGVHAGHAALIQCLSAKAREHNLRPVLVKLSFKPKSLFGKPYNKSLTTEDEAIRLLQGDGLSKIEAIPFTLTKIGAALNPEQFIKKILVGKFNAKIIVAGDNCRFGKGAEGGARTIAGLADKYGYKAFILPAVRFKDELRYAPLHEEILTGAPSQEDILTSAPSQEEILAGAPLQEGILPDTPYSEYPQGVIVSAEMIRYALINRDMETVNTLLGRPYSISGTVIGGNALGRRSNMPTANIRPPAQKLLPTNGVYATIARIGASTDAGADPAAAEYFSLTHIGRRPTVDNSKAITVETYLIGFSGDLYNQAIEIELHKFIRNTRKFNSLDAVKAQVDKDIRVALGYFNSFG